MKLSDNRVPLVKTKTLLPLIAPITMVCSIPNVGFDWISFLTAFVITYPLWCFSVQSVLFYDECIVIFRPFVFCKKIIFYDQIEYIKDTSIGKFFATTSPFDLDVYIRGKKHPIGISMPSSLQKRDKLKKIIESKEIQAEWGMYK